MITELFSALADIITGLVNSLVSAITGIIPLFYESGPDGGFRFLGLLLLIGFGLFFVMMAWKVIQGLIRGRGN